MQGLICLLFLFALHLGCLLEPRLMVDISRVNVNLAMVLATSGSFVMVQLAFWLLYHSPLTWLQCLGILLVGLGTAMASRAEPGAAHEEVRGC